MTWNVRSLLPSRISSQIALLAVASMIAVSVVASTTFLLTRPDLLPEHFPNQLLTLIWTINAAPRDARPRLVADLAEAFPGLAMALATDEPRRSVKVGNDDADAKDLAFFLGPNYAVTRLDPDATAPPADTRRIAVRLHDGEYVTVRLGAIPSSTLIARFVITLIGTVISITLLGLWAAGALTRPLREFAKAAQNFNPTGEIALLPERGPDEVRAAARALNRMCERIKNLIEDRTRTLAAVSHDLRTPITRLRLRCEFIEDSAARTKMLDELSHMNAMVESVLHYLRDGRTGQNAVMLDVATSLQTICDQFADTGSDISYDGPDHVVIRAQAEELQRALANLIDNAIRHGGKATVRASQSASTVTIAIEDDGPGIPDSIKDAVFEPFVRGDSARGMTEKVGFGLGLSIARAIIEAHGGSLTLLDRQPHGLIAMVTLPRAGAGPATSEDRTTA